MEFSFDASSQKLACYDLWNKSRGYEDLFAYQACTQAKLGLNKTHFSQNKLKLIRKNAVGWVRDGYLTDSSWALRDFMIHGWKRSKLNSEWKWPFIRKIFDLETCQRLPLLKTFQYNKAFVKSNAKISESLEKWRLKTKNDLYNVLDKFNITV